MRVIWTPEASQDRDDIWNYIAADNPYAAADMDELSALPRRDLPPIPCLAIPEEFLVPVNSFLKKITCWSMSSSRILDSSVTLEWL